MLCVTQHRRFLDSSLVLVGIGCPCLKHYLLTLAAKDLLAGSPAKPSSSTISRLYSARAGCLRAPACSGKPLASHCVTLCSDFFPFPQAAPPFLRGCWCLWIAAGAPAWAAFLPVGGDCFAHLVSMETGGLGEVPAWGKGGKEERIIQVQCWFFGVLDGLRVWDRDQSYSRVFLSRIRCVKSLFFYSIIWCFLFWRRRESLISMLTKQAGK